MVADGLAEALARAFVAPGDRVLDPFCGTGRILAAAAEKGAHCVGVDVNPLAVLVTRAKAGHCSAQVLSDLLQASSLVRARGKRRDLPRFETDRKVAWFSRKVTRELWGIVGLVNSARLPTPELSLVATVLAATVREVSFCRDGQWKLHRLPARLRRRWRRSPWAVFRRRLELALCEVRAFPDCPGRLRALVGDARQLSGALRAHRITPSFDIVVTSPPYGDSRTTVHYGGISSLCLSVLCYIERLGVAAASSASIDRLCLGGATSASPAQTNSGVAASALHHYWRGGQNNPVQTRVRRFLEDLERSCQEVTRVLRPGGHFVVVVGRRRTGGWRLYLDRMIIDVCREEGLRLEGLSTRQIVGKRTPARVDTLGRQQAKAHVIDTIKEEHILVFSKRSKPVS